MTTFSLLRTPTERDRLDVNRLTPQLSAHGGHTSKTEFAKIVKDPNNFFLVIRDKKTIVGMAMLVLLWTPLMLRGEIASVIVDEKYRGKGLGKQLLQKLIAIAKKKKLVSVQLTSRPERETAQKLYTDVGFEIHKTNVFRLKLKP